LKPRPYKVSRRHEYGTARTGRLFRGCMLSNRSYGRAWHAARRPPSPSAPAWPPPRTPAPPYALRHAALSPGAQRHGDARRRSVAGPSSRLPRAAITVLPAGRSWPARWPRLHPARSRRWPAVAGAPGGAGHATINGRSLDRDVSCSARPRRGPSRVFGEQPAEQGHEDGPVTAAEPGAQDQRPRSAGGRRSGPPGDL